MTGSLGFKVLENETEDQFFSLELGVYVTPPDERTIVLPYHRMKAALFTSTGNEVFQLDRFRVEIEAPHVDALHYGPRLPFILPTRSEVIIAGPGRMTLVATGEGEVADVEAIQRSCEARFLIRLATNDQGLTIRQRFTKARLPGEYALRWRASFGPARMPLPSGL
jgi:hypothetical protein